MGSSIVLFLLLRLVVPCSAQQKEIEAEPGTNDNTFPEQLLQKCAATVQALSRMAQQIQNTDVRGKVSQLEELSGKILNEVKERPEKTSKISTFVNYYIPTTINILNAYRRAEATGIEGENISNYVKLRDIGEAVGFNVYWDGRSVQIDSDAPYTGTGPKEQSIGQATDERGLTYNADGSINLPQDGSKYIPSMT